MFPFFFFFSFSFVPQSEISEVFDKLHHVNGNDNAVEVTDTLDSISESPKPVVKQKTSPRKLNNGVKSNDIDDWNSLAQFEKLIKVEMENLASAKIHQNGSTNTLKKINSNNILKPEKHVSRCLLQVNEINFRH